MPAGRVHEVTNLIVLPGTLYYLPEQLSKFGFTVGYLIGTFWITPDLDLASSRPMKRWGGLRLIWLPYCWLIPHRGISHRPILGALTRLLYLASIAGLGLWVVDKFGYHWQWHLPARQSWVSFFVGLLMADGLHILLDILLTQRRRKIKMR